MKWKIVISAMIIALSSAVNGCSAIKKCCSAKSGNQTEQAGTCNQCGGTSCNKDCSSQIKSDTTKIKN